MNDTPPRLATNSAGPAYAPISGTAVASLAVGVLFVVALVIVGGMAFFKKQQFIEFEVLVFPALGVLLAFVARRQIANSEGTRVGENYANAGWWLNVLGGLGYVAYVLGVEFAIRNDAEREFKAWAGHVVAIDPANPADPNVYQATWRTQPPGSRVAVKPDNAAAMEAQFRDALVGFRQMDVVRIAGRNRGAAKFEILGVKDWQQTQTKINCTLACKLSTPEGDFDLIVPMEAAIDQGRRSWQIRPSSSGLVQGQSLTKYGWLVSHTEDLGKQFAFEVLNLLRNPGQQPIAYDAFVRPDTTPAWPRFLIEDQTRYAVTGNIGRLYPEPLGYAEGVDRLFALPGGVKPTDADVARFRFCWNNGRIARAGTTLKDSPDANPVLRVTPEAVEYLIPVELQLPGGQGPAGTARGKIVLRSTDPALAGEFAAAKKDPGPQMTAAPAELAKRPIPWRIVRIESDLKPVPIAPKGGPDGGPAGF